MEVESRIRVYEIDGNSEVYHQDMFMSIKNKWNENRKVIIVTPKGDSYTVLASELKKAIVNAENS